MGTNSKIGWTTHTENFWIGCKEVSPGCDNCYARTWVEGRMGKPFWPLWRTTPGTWNNPRKWNKAAQAAGKPAMVFTCSLSDFFLQAADPWRADAWEVIRSTPWLRWQILTKRPDLIRDRLPADWGDGWPNCWLGVSAENDEWARRRIPVLAEIPASVRFVSFEPLLGPIDATGRGGWDPASIHWGIIGGESGEHWEERKMDLQWAEDLAYGLEAVGVAVYFKQRSAFKPDQPAGTRLDSFKLYPQAA